MFSVVVERVTPNYEAIFNKRDEYKKMTKARVAAHLNANHFRAPFGEVDMPTIVSVGALVLVLIPLVVLVPMGCAFVDSGLYFGAKITWIVCGTTVGTLLTIALGFHYFPRPSNALGFHYFRRPSKLSENEFKHLMESLEHAKDKDIEILKGRVTKHDKMAHDSQKKLEDLEKLNFKSVA